MNNQNYKSWLIALLVIGVVFTSCSPIIYRPNAINTPLFHEKGEFQASLNSGTNGSNKYPR